MKKLLLTFLILLCFNSIFWANFNYVYHDCGGGYTNVRIEDRGKYKANELVFSGKILRLIQYAESKDSTGILIITKGQHPSIILETNEGIIILDYILLRDIKIIYNKYVEIYRRCVKNKGPWSDEAVKYTLIYD